MLKPAFPWVKPKELHMKITAEHKRYTEYLQHLPDAIPPGRYLVHNHVRPTRRLGTRGFRAWLQNDLDDREVCPCKWAPELGTHYRVASVQLRPRP
jgi:hypothetical protein